jgi:probable rRNA maturation factor
MSPDDIPLLFAVPSRLHRGELRNFLGQLTKSVTRGLSISCLLTGDRQIRQLNQKFRGKNTATDVLSFPARGQNGLAGDIAISLDRAKLQAREQRHSLAIEVRILMLHGALHLSGMDHESDGGEMAKAEIRWRKRLGLPAGLIERVEA